MATVIVGVCSRSCGAPSTGSEVMRPLAVPVLGGMISSFIHIMIVTPVLFDVVARAGNEKAGVQRQLEGDELSVAPEQLRCKFLFFVGDEVTNSNFFGF